MNFKNMLENRQDRLLAFFDAILAIAITMIAIEIAVPEIGSLDAVGRYDFFVVITSYLISFTAMALSVSAAVICLMFSIWLCYIALAVGVVAVILIRTISSKSGSVSKIVVNK